MSEKCPYCNAKYAKFQSKLDALSFECGTYKYIRAYHAYKQSIICKKNSANLARLLERNPQ